MLCSTKGGTGVIEANRSSIQQLGMDMLVCPRPWGEVTGNGGRTRTTLTNMRLELGRYLLRDCSSG